MKNTDIKMSMLKQIQNHEVFICQYSILVDKIRIKMGSQDHIFVYLFKLPSCSIKGICIFYWDLKMRMLWVSLTFAILKEESIFKSTPE